MMGNRIELHESEHTLPSLNDFLYCLMFFVIVVGVETEADYAAKLVSELEGKDVQEVIAAGKEKLASVPAGGAVAAAPAAAGGAGGAAPAAEEKKEESEEEDADMGFSLFD